MFFYLESLNNFPLHVLILRKSRIASKCFNDIIDVSDPFLILSCVAVKFYNSVPLIFLGIAI